VWAVNPEAPQATVGGGDAGSAGGAIEDCLLNGVGYWLSRSGAAQFFRAQDTGVPAHCPGKLANASGVASDLGNENGPGQQPSYGTSACPEVAIGAPSYQVLSSCTIQVTLPKDQSCDWVYAWAIPLDWNAWGGSLGEGVAYTLPVNLLAISYEAPGCGMPPPTTTSTVPPPIYTSSTCASGATSYPWTLTASGPAGVIDDGSENRVTFSASFHGALGPNQALVSESMQLDQVFLRPVGGAGVSVPLQSPGADSWAVLSRPYPYYAAASWAGPAGGLSQTVTMVVNAPSPVGAPYEVSACGTVSYTVQTTVQTTCPGPPATPGGPPTNVACTRVYDQSYTQGVAASLRVAGYGPAVVP
jgi:hypothetical protein